MNSEGAHPARDLPVHAPPLVRAPGELAWLRHAPLARAAALLFLGCAIAAGVGFGLAALDGEKRRDTQLAAILRPEYTGNDRLAPDFTLHDHRGRPFRLSSLRGKVVVLHFWSRDCPPCVQELSESLPTFDELIQGRNDIALVLVGTERWEEVSALIPANFRSPLLFDPERAVVLHRYGTRLFPETWIIDPEGVIRARFDRTLDWGSPVFLQYVRSFR